MNGWRTIDSAPKDGSEFLAYDSRTGKQDVCSYWAALERPYPVQSDGEMGPSEDEFGYNGSDITHWKPLDPPPEGDEVTMSGREDRHIQIGMVMAAALIAEADPTLAAEIVVAASLDTIDLMNSAGVDQYDIGLIVKHGVIEIAASIK